MTAAQQYIRDVKKHLRCSQKTKRRALENLRCALTDMDDLSDYADIATAYGEPQAVAEEYLSVMSDKELKHITFWKAFAIGISIIGSIFVLILLIDFIWLTIDSIGDYIVITNS